MRTTTFAILLLLAAAPALAQQGGLIGIYPDNPGFMECNLTETVGVSNYVYVVHTIYPEATQSQFMLLHNWVEAALVGVDYGTNLHVGDIFTGVIVMYGGCKPLPHLLVTITFLPTAATQGCRLFQVLADPATFSGSIETVDCQGNTLIGAGGLMCVNEPLCCISADPYDCQPPLASEQSTWSRVKALYR